MRCFDIFLNEIETIEDAYINIDLLLIKTYGDARGM